MPEILFKRLQDALLDKDPRRKCDSVAMIFARWGKGRLVRDTGFPTLPIDTPGKPELPRLVDPRQLSRRTTSSREGRISLLHAFAHIEFNAINIALDAAYRFRQMPDQFVSDWLLVACEEAKHFNLLSEYLCDQGSLLWGAGCTCWIVGYGVQNPTRCIAPDGPGAASHGGPWPRCYSRHDKTIHRYR